MNAKRRVILYVAIVVASGMLLFPPYIFIPMKLHEAFGGLGSSSRPTTVGPVDWRSGGGYQFLLSASGRLDFGTLFLQFGLLSLVTSAAWIAAGKDGKDKQQ